MIAGLKAHLIAPAPSNEIGLVDEMKPGDFKPVRSSVLQIKLMEVNMAKTAVGLFENPGSVDEVVRELKASGIPQKDVRVLREPREMAGSGVMSTPHTDFEVDLIRELEDDWGRRSGRGSLRPRSTAWRSHGFRNRLAREGGRGC